jgi:hypothetical protein
MVGFPCGIVSSVVTVDDIAQASRYLDGVIFRWVKMNCEIVIAVHLSIWVENWSMWMCSEESEGSI